MSTDIPQQEGRAGMCQMSGSRHGRPPVMGTRNGTGGLGPGKHGLHKMSAIALESQTLQAQTPTSQPKDSLHLKVSSSSMQPPRIHLFRVFVSFIDDTNYTLAKRASNRRCCGLFFFSETSSMLVRQAGIEVCRRWVLFFWGTSRPMSQLPLGHRSNAAKSLFLGSSMHLVLGSPTHDERSSPSRRKGFVLVFDGCGTSTCRFFVVPLPSKVVFILAFLIACLFRSLPYCPFQEEGDGFENAW